VALLAVAEIRIVTAVAGFLNGVNNFLNSTVESMLRDPSQLPGLKSNLVYNVAYTVDGVVYNLVRPLIDLPAPIGYSSTSDGLVYKTCKGFSDSLDKVLSYLPTPVTPTALAAVAAVNPAAAKAVAAVSPSKDAVATVPSTEANTVTVVTKAADQTDPASLPRKVFRGKLSLAPVNATAVASNGDASDSAKAVKSRLSKRGGGSDDAPAKHSTSGPAAKLGR
jgi:hypothetical protein